MAERLDLDDVENLIDAAQKWKRSIAQAKRLETIERIDHELRQACADVAWPVDRNEAESDSYDPMAPTDPTPEQQRLAEGYMNVIVLAQRRAKRSHPAGGKKTRTD